MRFRSDSCTAASGPGQAGRLELRVENEQEIGLGKVIHSHTQITHTFSGDGEGIFPQLVHSPGADRSSAGGSKEGKRARSGAREVLHNFPSLRVRFSTAVWA